MASPGRMLETAYETRIWEIPFPLFQSITYAHRSPEAGIHFGQRIPKLEFPRTEPRPPRRRRYPVNAGSEPRITTSGMTPDSWRRRLASALTGRSRYARIDGEGMPRWPAPERPSMQARQAEMLVAGFIARSSSGLRLNGARAFSRNRTTRCRDGLDRKSSQNRR